MTVRTEERSLEFVDYLRVLRRRIWFVLLALVVTTAVALGLSLRKSEAYRASTQINVSGSGSNVVLDPITQRSINTQIAESMAQYATTPPAVDAAWRALGGTAGSEAVEASANGPVLTISVTGPIAERTSALANSFAGVIPDVYRSLASGASAETPKVVVLRPAATPSDPYTPRPQRDGLLGLAVGLVLGVVLAFAREALDRSVKDPDVLEHLTGLPVLGVVPRELAGDDLPTVNNPMSSRAEGYRTVRTNSQFAGSDDAIRTIVVTSAMPGEGKTTVAVNLAVAFAATGHRVVIVDADLRKPRVAQVLEMDRPAAGLAEVLTGKATLDEALIVQPQMGLHVVASGVPPRNPSELLGSTEMVNLLEALSNRFDVVVIDSPPILPVTDPLVLGVQCSSLLLVVRLGSTSRERLNRALASIRKLDLPVLGIVANGAVASGDAAYTYGYRYAYGDDQKRSRRRRKESGAEVESSHD